jgi:TPP-dependent pyruvate/acetoin dehydrogenase alpha subunit
MQPPGGPDHAERWGPVGPARTRPALARRRSVLAMEVTDDLELYARMSFLRQFLQKADSLYRQGQIHGPVHLGLGQEAIAIGAASVLRPDDYSIGTYRGHAHALARGAPPEAVLAELLGRTGGICAGKGGSMHITSVEHGYYGSYAIVGAHLPVACGLAWAAKIQRTGQVTVCFFGDGAVNIGAFHEAVNLAAVWRLPVVFVCENNWYMEYTPIVDMIPVPRPAADRASAYGLAAIVVDGNDVHAVRQVVGDAVAAARNGQGPSLIEAQTYRLKGHSGADGGTYRPADEVARWTAREPLLRSREALLQAGTPESTLAEIDVGARAELAALAQQVLARPAPDPATAWTDVWSDGGGAWRN